MIWLVLISAFLGAFLNTLQFFAFRYFVHELDLSDQVKTFKHSHKFLGVWL